MVSQQLCTSNHAFGDSDILTFALSWKLGLYSLTARANNSAMLSEPFQEQLHTPLNSGFWYLASNQIQIIQQIKWDLEDIPNESPK